MIEAGLAVDFYRCFYVDASPPAAPPSAAAVDVDVVVVAVIFTLLTVVTIVRFYKNSFILVPVSSLNPISYGERGPYGFTGRKLKISFAPCRCSRPGYPINI